MRKKWYFFVISCVVCLVLIILFLSTYKLEIVQAKSVDNKITYDTSFDDYVTANVVNMFGCVHNPSVEVVGTYNDVANNSVTVYYFAKYMWLNDTLRVTYDYIDTIPPEIILIEGDVYVDSDGNYTDVGFSAIDNVDGNVTDKVSVTLFDDELVYTVSDCAGNVTTVSRSVMYLDDISPVINLIGGSEIHIPFDCDYIEPGFTAVDNFDGDITNRVFVSNNIDTSVCGKHIISYSVFDSSQNYVSVDRTIIVDEPTSKVIYLTFDDGPGPYTEELLDVLDKYNVKVTFFVTNQYPSYRDLIGESYRRGHTVAIHTYSHDYSDVYSSEDAYFNDLYEMQSIIYEQTGVLSNLVRFPGGGSNSVSRNYSEGIMSRLSRLLDERGFVYFDWNVSSGDAGSIRKKETVFNNVTKGCVSNNVSVVLQHDVKHFSVVAVEDIIIWGLDNGYTFLPLTENSPTMHHSIIN